MTMGGWDPPPVHTAPSILALAMANAKCQASMDRIGSDPHADDDSDAFREPEPTDPAAAQMQTCPVDESGMLLHIFPCFHPTLNRPSLQLHYIPSPDVLLLYRRV